MKRSYRITQHLRGELHLGPGPDATTYEYEPGDHKPKDAAESAVLDHLVTIGTATLAVAPKHTKESKP